MQLKRSLAVLLSANLWALTFGPEVASVFAAETSAQAPVRLKLPSLPAVPTGLASSLPAQALSPAASPAQAPAAVPSAVIAAPAAAPMAASRALQAQARQLAAQPSRQKQVLDRSFEGAAQRAAGEDVSIPEIPAAASGLRAAGQPGGAEKSPPIPARAQRRSAFFPLSLAATASAAAALFFGAKGLLVHAASAAGWSPAYWSLPGAAGI